MSKKEKEIWTMITILSICFFLITIVPILIIFSKDGIYNIIAMILGINFLTTGTSIMFSYLANWR